MRVRPFKVRYFSGGHQVGRVSACSTPEGVLKSVAVHLFTAEGDITYADVHLDGDPFAEFELVNNNLKMRVS